MADDKNPQEKTKDLEEESKKSKASEKADDKSTQDKMKSLEEENKKLKASEEALLEELETLQKQHDEQSKELPFQTVSHSNKKYKVAARKFRYNGKDYKDEELKDHPDVIKALVEKNSGILVPMSKK